MIYCPLFLEKVDTNAVLHNYILYIHGHYFGGIILLYLATLSSIVFFSARGTAFLQQKLMQM